MEYHHPRINLILDSLASSHEFPNLLFYGPAGSGKRTRIKYFLEKLYGKTMGPVKQESREYKVQTKYVTVNMLRSFQHIEITSDLGVYDRIVVQQLIREVAETQTFAKIKLKTVVVHQADSLTRQAQQALRRTMEKYSKNCRIILCCESFSQIIEPLRSRCLAIRVPAPSKKELSKILDCKVSEVPNTRNILHAEYGVEKLDWELYIEQLVQDIVDKKPMLKLREYLYTLLVSGVPPQRIFRNLTKELIKAKGPEVIEWGAHYQHRSIQGQKPMYHLEAFIARVL